MRLLFSVLFLLHAIALFAQGRRLPDFSFAQNSTRFADANRAYNDQRQYTDTVYDAHTLEALLQIMQKNRELMIEVTGHTTFHEDTVLGYRRADTIRDYLLASGIDSSRVRVLNRGYSEAVINQEIIRELPTQIEVEAAHQKNRRATVRVIGVRREE